MNDQIKEKIRLTSREILLTFFDGITVMEEIFSRKWNRREIHQYWKWRELDKERFYSSLRRLEKQGYIKRHMKNKKNHIKLTPIGTKRAVKYVFDESGLKLPAKWDKRWRLVIFDIPSDKKNLREIVRERLKKWGFCQLQKSVFIYPFDCQEEISALKYYYNVSSYLQYMVIESIETEKDLVKIFLNKNLLKRNHLS